MMKEHFSLPPPIPSQLNPQLPKEFDHILVTCLAKRPADRYQGVDQLLHAFEAACGQRGIAEVLVPQPTIEPSYTPPPPPPPFPSPPPPDSGVRSPTPNRGASIPMLAGAGLGAGAMVMIGGIALVGLLVLFLMISGGGGAPASTPLPTAIINSTNSSPISQPTAVINSTDAPPNTPVVVIREITATPPPAATFTPIPAGQIAFASDQNGHDSIYIMNDDGSNRTRITDPSGADQDWWPTWCNHGSEIIFERGDHQRGSTSQTLYSVSLSRPFGEQLWPYVPRNVLMTGHPICNRSSTYVAFSSVAPGENYFKIWLADLRGGDSYLFADFFERGTLDFSPDGRTVVFSAYGADGFRVYTAEVNNPSSAVEITLSGITGPNFPTWSPDGTKLAFTCRIGGEGGLCVSDSNGANLRVIVPDARIDANRTDLLLNAPTWSPDGKWIAFSSNTDGDWDIYIIRPDGTGILNITKDWTSHEFHPSWKP
jgi:TolB protein